MIKDFFAVNTSSLGLVPSGHLWLMVTGRKLHGHWAHEIKQSPGDTRSPFFLEDLFWY